MAGVRKKGQRFYAIFKDVTGKKVERPVKARTLTEARRRANELEEVAWSRRNHLKVAPSSEPLAEVAPRFLHSIRHHASYPSIESRWRLHILPALGEMPLGVIRATDIDELLAAKRDEEYGQQTRRHLRMTVSAFFKWAKKAGLVDANPVEHVKLIPVPTPAPKAFTWEQVEALRDAAGPQWLKDLIWVAAHLALRYSELRRVTWPDVDLQQRLVAVRRSKTDQPRPAVIPAVLVPYMQEMWRRRRGQFLFSYEDGGQLPVTSPDARFKAAMKAAALVSGYELVCRRKGCGYVEASAKGKSTPCPKCGFALWPRALPARFSFKDLRSTAITRIIDMTGNPRAAQLQAAHEDIRTTLRHYHAPDLDVQREAVDRAFAAVHSTGPQGSKAST
ncbi:site-specific integrase [Pyxidicoccus parkwayensis]|uniref:Site-specific integrase n=1 Tax=Pyxidicoccus parkwayensis TaxID=2813578 RepID=A0ABX7P350_9BACT|nr:site-specific integrase [Pyxidicoccus parkwaysis]QSQ24893.1 site-specific integrase [Pyxidicoccus parkwaysis]